MTAQKKLLVLSSFLFSILICSYLPFFNLNKSQQSVKSAVLNPKYSKAVFEIDFGNNFMLAKENDFWFVNFMDFVIPANQIEVSKFLEKISKVQHFYKISDSMASLKKLKLSEINNSDFYITFKYSDEKADVKKSSTILFNLQKQASGQIFLRSLANFSSFAINDSDFASYLTGKIDFWADASIIPKSVFAKDKLNSIQRITIFKGNKKSAEKTGSGVEKLSSLTHGQVFTDKSFLNNSKNTEIYSLFVEYGDTSKIKIDVFPYKAENYVLYYTFFPAKHYEAQKAKSIAKMNFAFTISLWTLQNILSTFDLSL